MEGAQDAAADTSSLDGGAEAGPPEDLGMRDATADLSPLDARADATGLDAASDAASDAPADQPGADVSCEVNQVACDGRCVYLAFDRDNCGACGNRCGEGNRCTQGRCACPPGGVSCCTSQVCRCSPEDRFCTETWVCFDGQTDPAHCGGCGVRCLGTGNACVAGRCDCPPPRSLCQGSCVSLDTNANCGACGRTCPAGTTCAGGICFRSDSPCDAPLVRCAGVCANTQSDPDHCGACGRTCPRGAPCVNGLCTQGCPTGTTLCGGTCVDTQTSSTHCGACGNACPTGQACVAGQCRCAAMCDGVCTDTQTNAAHCGACGNACAAGQLCLAGACATAHRSCPSQTERGCGQVEVGGGTFTMGEGSPASLALPTHPATVGSFVLDAYEVTVARFRRFWAAGHPGPGPAIVYPEGSIAWTGSVVEPDTSANCYWSASAGSREQHPLNCVDWHTAQAFCVWDGGRLPTEAEWEYVARGRALAGLTVPRAYPWGDQAPVGSPTGTCDRAQWRCPGEDGAATRQVGRFAASGGVFDLAGNVGEWVADSNVPPFNYTTSCWGTTPRTDPLCNVGTIGYRGLRGGSWDNIDLYTLRAASRDFLQGTERVSYIGFRCARRP